MDKEAQRIDLRQEQFNMKELLQSLVETTMDAISIRDMQGNVLFVNSAFEKIYGWTYQDLLNDPYCLVPEDLINETKEIFHEIKFEGKNITGYETVRQRKNGEIVQVGLTASPIRDTEGTIVGTSVIARDITDRKMAEEALVNSEAKYRILVENTSDVICQHDVHMNNLFVSPSIEQHLGYTPDEFLQTNSFDLIHPEDVKIVKDLHNLISTHPQNVQVEIRLRHKNGSWVYWESRCVPIMSENKEVESFLFVSRNITERKQSEAALRKSEEQYRFIAEHTADFISVIDKNGHVSYSSPSHLKKLGTSQIIIENIHPEDAPLVCERFSTMLQFHIPISCEYRYKLENEKWIYLESKGMPFFSSDGESQYFINVTRDITERKQNEELLRRTEKLSVIGELAASIAHEIRNPLTSLKGFIQYLRPTLSEGATYTDIMLSELDRINFIVSELLVLAKPQTLNVKRILLHPLIESVVKFLESEANLNNITINTIFSQMPIAINGEENQVKQVFINILKNSLDAITTNGEISIETTCLHNNQVLIRFTDNGCGISQELLPRLGEPFYTTKEKGTGLGLLVSNKIMKDHQGTITISSEINKGTLVEIMFPISK
ncbi:two-component system sporulation sensor kinase A [Brevibacillus sp. AG162]|uniref:PAS domain-containing sensor histidine kinase n=1 Tax=Brevibacillus sp. AG162 TaxID=2572910 RepID=UPI00115216D5|nr:PAS domain-containing sensor histidine kinase [Brevibacillus sp. AG162]TQK63900.1 two-component system sporulation sensor kinase A [Brevibacillus sp. AG162]